MDIIADPTFYLLAVPAVLIAGISKAGIGGGLGIVAVPLMTLVISPVQAAAILLPILCLMDLFGLHAYRGAWDRRNVTLMLPGALMGIIVGALAFRYLSDDVVRLIVGTVALAFVLYRVVGNFILRRATAQPRAAGPRGMFWAGLSGFTSFVAHAGAPPIQVYLLPQRMDKTIYVGTMTLFFAAVNYAKLIPYGMLGQLSANNLGTALVLAPAIPLGIWLGLRLHRILNETLFYRVVFGILTLTGLRLVWKGLEGMIGG